MDGNERSEQEVPMEQNENESDPGPSRKRTISGGNPIK
jgi:hypothetical protein